MQTMKRIIMFCLVASVLVNVFFADEAVKADVSADARNASVISKIKVFLDDEELTAENCNAGKIKLSTILSYTSLKTGKEFTESALEKEIEQTELRLLNSGLFYNAKVEKMASRKNPGTYVIYFTLTTGFLKRYGGSGIYAVIGKAALNGNRDMLLWNAGWNKNGLSYLNENVFGKPVILGADLNTNLPAGLKSIKGAELNGKVTVGGLINPDFRICVDVVTGFNFDSMSFNNNLIISPYISTTKFISDKCFYTNEVRFTYTPLQNSNQFFDTAVTVNYTPVTKYTFAAMAAGGYSNNGNQIKLYRNQETLCYNLGLTNKEIRSGYTQEELTVKGYLMATVEARWNALSFPIPPCFPCHVSPYLFTDVALVEKVSDANVQAHGPVQMMDAYGVGVYIKLDCPVFITFNLSYGVNSQGQSKCTFVAIQSF